MKKENIVKTHRFRIVPTAEQEEVFRRYEGVCCMLWNAGIDYQNFRCFGGVFNIDGCVKSLPPAEKPNRSFLGSGTGKYNKNGGIGHGYANFKRKESGLAAQWVLLRDDPDFAYLQELNSITCRHILKRLDDSYNAAFKGARGYPSYTRRADFCSFTVPSGRAKVTDNKLRLPGAGSAKSASFIRMRPRHGKGKVDLEGGEITDVIIKREGENTAGNRWFAYIQCKYKDSIIPAPRAGVAGIDANVANIAVWDGKKSEIIRMPDELRMQARRRRYQRAQSRKMNAALCGVGWDGKSATRKTAQARLGKIRAEKVEKRKQELMAGGLEEYKAREIAYQQIPYISKKYGAAKRQAAKASRRVAGGRSDWTHKTSKKISEQYGIIVVEKLNLKGMTKSAKGTRQKPGKSVKAKSGLNRSMLASCHGMLKSRIAYKAEWNGGRMEEINPAYTSQMCNKCGAVNKKSRRATEKFVCRDCGHAENAQTNAAINILNKFMQEAKGEKASVRGDGGIIPKRQKRAGSRSMKRKTSIKQTANTPKTAIKQPDKPNGDSLPFV